MAPLVAFRCSLIMYNNCSVYVAENKLVVVVVVAVLSRLLAQRPGTPCRRTYITASQFQYTFHRHFHFLIPLSDSSLICIVSA